MFRVCFRFINGSSLPEKWTSVSPWTQAGADAPRPFASPALYSGAFTYTFAPSDFVGSPPAADLTVSVYLAGRCSLSLSSPR